MGEGRGRREGPHREPLNWTQPPGGARVPSESDREGCSLDFDRRKRGSRRGEQERILPPTDLAGGESLPRWEARRQGGEAAPPLRAPISAHATRIDLRPSQDRQACSRSRTNRVSGLPCARRLRGHTGHRLGEQSCPCSPALLKRGPREPRRTRAPFDTPRPSVRSGHPATGGSRRRDLSRHETRSRAPPWRGAGGRTGGGAPPSRPATPPRTRRAPSQVLYRDSMSSGGTWIDRYLSSPRPTFRIPCFDPDGKKTAASGPTVFFSRSETTSPFPSRMKYTDSTSGPCLCGGGLPPRKSS